MDEHGRKRNNSDTERKALHVLTCLQNLKKTKAERTETKCVTGVTKGRKGEEMGRSRPKGKSLKVNMTNNSRDRVSIIVSHIPRF
jgi:hypothetical protein